jgi:putative ABC transport system permease protein
MYRISLQMLTHDRAKFLAIVISLSFSALIITQQAAIFFGLIMRTYSTITDASQADIWVVDPGVQMIDDVKPLRETDLYRVRSVEGVAWAVPFFRGLIRAKLSDGHFQTCVLLGIDDATFIGGPSTLASGTIVDLRNPDAIIIDDYETRDKLAIQEKGTKEKRAMRIGDILEINDKRAIVAGTASIAKPFLTQPVIYTTYKRALSYVPFERKQLSFILVRPVPSLSAQEVCKTITKTTGLLALTSYEFKQKTMRYYLENTGIPLNFGIAIALGIFIGAALAGQIFFNFTSDALPYLGLLSLMGASKRLLAKMTLLQAAWVAFLGWNIGSGAAALMGYCFSNTQLSFYMPLELYLATGAIIFIMCMITAFISISRIYRADLGEIFKR